MVHKMKYGEVSAVLRSCFRQVSEVHNHFTRASVADVVPPPFKSKFGKGSFIYIGATQWNSLTVNIKLTVNQR